MKFFQKRVDNKEIVLILNNKDKKNRLENVLYNIQICVKKLRWIYIINKEIIFK